MTQASITLVPHLAYGKHWVHVTWCHHHQSLSQDLQCSKGLTSHWPLLSPCPGNKWPQGSGNKGSEHNPNFGLRKQALSHSVKAQVPHSLLLSQLERVTQAPQSSSSQMGTVTCIHPGRRVACAGGCFVYYFNERSPSLGWNLRGLARRSLCGLWRGSPPRGFPLSPGAHREAASPSSLAALGATSPSFWVS